MKLQHWLMLAGFVALAEGAGVVGSLFTTPAIAGWYTTLVRPALAPPNWVFAPVWTTLFLFIGVAVFLAWRHAMHRRLGKEALAVWGLQLVLNVLWSALFFGLHNPGLALLEIMMLWAVILWNILLFYKISRTAGLLLVPYLAWVSFAAYLNYAIWALN